MRPGHRPSNVTARRMDRATLDIWVGCAAVVLALGVIIALVIWSRRRIDRIAAGRGRTAREITRELDRGRK